MGHTEMLLAVAGLDDAEVIERTGKLASGDLSEFPVGDRIAFTLARKQARAPWSVNDSDVSELVEQFGLARTIDILWWSARCHYMTRVADAFQLPLERENVFREATPSK